MTNKQYPRYSEIRNYRYFYYPKRKFLFPETFFIERFLHIKYYRKPLSRRTLIHIGSCRAKEYTSQARKLFYKSLKELSILWEDYYE